MQIVIDIPEEDYQVTLIKIMLAFYGCKTMVLPKGHGRLIDADTLLSKAKLLYKGYETALTNTIGDAQTIIEADKEVDDGT